jgi:hypothetical protein
MIGGTMARQGDPLTWVAARNGPVSGTYEADRSTAMHLLACGVPLSLIMDLAVPGGPPSQEIMTVEGLRDSAWWAR